MENTDGLSTCVFPREKCDLYFSLFTFHFSLYKSGAKLVIFSEISKEKHLKNEKWKMKKMKIVSCTC